MLPLLLTLAIASAPASLQDDAAFQDAVSLYDDLELEQAVLRLQELALDTSRSAEDRAQILVWLGLSYAQLGRFDDAKRNFELAVRADRDVELPRPAADKVRLLLEDARRAAPPPSSTPEPAAPSDGPPESGDERTPSPEKEPAPPADTTTEPAAGEEKDGSALVGGLKIGALGTGALAAGIGVVGVSTIGLVFGMLYATDADPSATQDDLRMAENTANTWPYIAGLTFVGVSVPLLAAGVLYGAALILDE